jgi:hypothetical protein
MKSHILHSYNTSNIDEEFTERCKDYNILPTIIPHKRRVIGIGDIHGDMNLAINFLKKAKVIKEICKNYFADKKIKEHRYKLRLHTNILDHDIINNDFDNLMNQSELVYRYYEVNGSDDLYVKIIQSDNNPNDIDTDEDKLKQCKLFDKDRWFKWIGEDTHVVQVGDQVDRCRPFGDFTCKSEFATKKDEDSDLEIMLFYDSLDKIAINSKSGGRVFSQLGNHEIMNVVGDLRYVSHKGLIEFSPEPKDVNIGLNIRQKVFETVISRKMACTRSTVLVIGDYLFVHGGIANKLAYKYKLLDINQIIRKFLHSLKSDNEIYKLLNSSRFSPLWYRQLAYIPQDVHGKKHADCENILDPILQTINRNNNPTIQIKGMVIGHTPQFTVFGTGITTACNNSIIRTDIGASSAFDIFSNNVKTNLARQPQVIEILTNLATKESSIQILK